jgi:NAD(P)-dependent dehydrogenase (short-subunit alcohol dehydrogenase family)
LDQPAFSLAGRTVLVAGASSGIGADVARTFARAGARLIVAARRVDRVQALAAEIGSEAMGIAMDVTDEASVIAAFDAAEERFGPVESVLANAGIGTGGRTTDTDALAVRAVIDTNLYGTYLVAREAARRMIAGGSAQSGRGRIVITGSITALTTRGGDTAYAATKAGLAHLTRQLAREWVRMGVNVNIVHPGYMVSGSNVEWYASERGKQDIASYNRRRMMTPDALDDMLLYLLSDRSAQVTGGEFTIDDGASL